jgi:hypothetical protein
MLSRRAVGRDLVESWLSHDCGLTGSFLVNPSGCRCEDVAGVIECSSSRQISVALLNLLGKVGCRRGGASKSGFKG